MTTSQSSRQVPERRNNKEEQGRDKHCEKHWTGRTHWREPQLTANLLTEMKQVSKREENEEGKKLECVMKMQRKACF